MRVLSLLRSSLVAMACLSVMAMGHSANVASDEIRLASDAWPPFTDVQGRPRFAMDLVNEALDRLGIGSTSSILPNFGEVMAGIREKRFDGSAALWRSPDREAYLLYSRHFLENRLVLVGRKDADVTPNSFAELAGKRVALVANYAYGEEVDSARGLTLVQGQSDQENLEMLLRGEVDYILVDDLLLQHVLTHQEDEARTFLEVGTSSFVRRTLHFAIRRDFPGAESIIQRFNAEIGSMLVDGTYNRILQLNWIRVDVDGDGRLELLLNGKEAGNLPPESVYTFRVGSAAGGDDEEDRYWIDGSMYESWSRVPDRYKVPPPLPGDSTPRGGGYTLRF